MSDVTPNHVPLANALRNVLKKNHAKYTAQERYQAVIDLLADMLVSDGRDQAIEMARDGQLEDDENPDDVGVELALMSLTDGESCVPDDLVDAINRIYNADAE